MPAKPLEPKETQMAHNAFQPQKCFSVLRKTLQVDNLT